MMRMSFDVFDGGDKGIDFFVRVAYRKNGEMEVDWDVSRVEEPVAAKRTVLSAQDLDDTNEVLVINFGRIAEALKGK